MAAFDPLQTRAVEAMSHPMVSFYRPMTPWWVAPLSIEGLFRASEIDRTVKRLRELHLQWRWASANDWPQRWWIGSDFRFARRGGFGFAVDIGDERLFLVPRGWEEPEWGLASYDVQQGRWRDLGDLEPTPEYWVFPTPEEHPSASA
jgi:hypothetical protein